MRNVGKHAVIRVVCLVLGLVLLLGNRNGETTQESSAARLVFLSAERIESEGDLNAALEEYGFLVEQFPSSEWADDALLRIALGWFRLGDYRACNDAAQRLIDGYPRTPSAAGGQALQAAIVVTTARSTEDFERARSAFRRIPLVFGPDAYPVLEWRTLAKARAGEISLLLGEEDEAASMLVDAIENEPRNRWTPRAMFAFAAVLYRQGQWQAAAQTLQAIVDEFVNSEQQEVQQQVAAAKRRLTLLHRTLIRPRAGQPVWSRAGVLALGGGAVKRPIGIAADSIGRLLIVDDDKDTVLMTDADGTVQRRRTVSGARRPWWGIDGTPFVLTESFVTRADQIGHATFVGRKADKPQPLKKLRAAETGLFGNWFLLDRNDRRLVQFGPDQTYLRTLIQGGRPEPVDIARDTDGRLYVLDRKNNTVVRFAADGAASQPVVSRRWKRAEAITVDELGNIYVLDRDARTIEIFAPSGQLLGSAGPNLPGGVRLGSPRDIAVDGAGRLLIADRDTAAVMVLE